MVQIGNVIVAERFINDGSQSVIINLAGQYSFKSFPSKMSFKVLVTLLNADEDAYYDMNIKILNKNDSELLNGNLNHINLKQLLRAEHNHRNGIVTINCNDFEFGGPGLYTTSVKIVNENDENDRSELSSQFVADKNVSGDQHAG